MSIHIRYWLSYTLFITYKKYEHDVTTGFVKMLWFIVYLFNADVKQELKKCYRFELINIKRFY